MHKTKGFKRQTTPMHNITSIANYWHSIYIYIIIVNDWKGLRVDLVYGSMTHDCTPYKHHAIHRGLHHQPPHSPVLWTILCTATLFVLNQTINILL